MQRSRRTRRVALPALVAAAVLAVACVPQAPSSTDSEACAPPGLPLSRVDVEIIEAPPGSTLKVSEHVRFLNSPPELPDWDIREVTITDAVAGRTLTIAAPMFLSESQLRTPDPGKCLRLSANGGLTYRAVLWADLDPVTILAWNLGILPGAYGASWGFPPAP